MNVSRWAKYSPRAVAGSYWRTPSASSPVSSTLEQVWTYNERWPIDSRMSYFANYENSMTPPVSLMWPEKLLKGKNNGFQPAYWDGLPYTFGLRDAIGVSLSTPIYMCVVYQRVSNGAYVYTTDSLDNDLTPFWTIGEQIKVSYCATTTPHLLTDQIGVSEFFGLRFDTAEQVSRTYTLEATSTGGNSIANMTLSNNAVYRNRMTYGEVLTDEGLLGFSVTASSGTSQLKRIEVAILEDNAAYNRIPLGSFDAVGNTVTTRSFRPPFIYAKDGVLLRPLWLEYTSGSERQVVMMRQTISEPL